MNHRGRDIARSDRGRVLSPVPTRVGTAGPSRAFGPITRRDIVRLSDQVWPGDKLAYEGVVSELANDGDSIVVTADLTWRRQTGPAAVSSSAKFRIPHDETANEPNGQT
jgi:hypothetical protein